MKQDKIWKRHLLWSLFSIRREERWVALTALVFFVALNALTIARYYAQFSTPTDDYWTLFIFGFKVSGFDPITYYVVSDWEARYNVYRHPLLSFYMYLPYLLNKGLMWLTGINCVQFVVAIMLVFSGFYAFIFLYRILREIVELRHSDAFLLTGLFFSFAFILLSAMVPDHFVISLMLLLLTLYVSGRYMKERKEMSLLTTIVLFVATAGVSLNNGLKIFMASWFVNGKRFLMPKHLFLAVILPAALMWGFCRFEYRQFVWEGEQARHALKAKKQKATAQKTKVIASKPTSSAKNDTTSHKPVSAPKPTKKRQIQGAPLMGGEFMRWTDVTTSRWGSVVENLFGESIQLHTDYLLQDVFRSRPMIVSYRYVFPYIIEGIVVLLFLVGIWMGRRSRFLWLALSWFLLDVALHIGLGFGINEVYIMSAHWMFVVPIAIGFLLHHCHFRYLPWLRGLLILLTAYLLIYNGWLIGKYLMA